MPTAGCAILFGICSAICTVLKRVSGVAVESMPELERFVLHRLAELDVLVRECCAKYDFHAMFTALHNFCAVELSSFYFDMRKDTLYCDPVDSLDRRAARTVLDKLYMSLTAWLAPIIPFTAEEAWLTRFPEEGDDGSIHLRQFSEIPSEWRNEALAEKWQLVRNLRRVVTGALKSNGQRNGLAPVSALTRPSMHHQPIRRPWQKLI